jgi:hypothetical protein
MSFLIELKDPHRTLTFETDTELPILHTLVQSVSVQLELLRAAVPLTSFKAHRDPDFLLQYHYKILAVDGRLWKQKFSFEAQAHNEPTMTFHVPDYWRLAEFVPHRTLRDSVFGLIRDFGLVRVEAIYG